MKKNLLLFFCLIYISAYSQGIKLNGPVSVENNLISNVSDPTKDQDAATKSYVDSNVNNSSINSLLDEINANGTGIAANLDVIVSNQAEALAWYLNTIDAISRLEVDMSNNGVEIVANGLRSDQNGNAIAAAQTAIIAQIMSVQLEIADIQQTQATILVYLNGLEASIQALQADVTTLLGD